MPLFGAIFVRNIIPVRNWSGVRASSAIISSAWMYNFIVGSLGWACVGSPKIGAAAGVLTAGLSQANSPKRGIRAAKQVQCFMQLQGTRMKPGFQSAKAGFTAIASDRGNAPDTGNSERLAMSNAAPQINLMKPSVAAQVSLQASASSAAAANWSRRSFLRSIACTTVAGPFLTACQAPKPVEHKVVSVKDRLNHACIGVGGMGWGDLQNFLQHPKVEIIALCDVDSDNLAKASKAAPRAQLYSDWRELLQKEGARLDSVNVSVPDHMHFAIAFSAIEGKKHVYCQKPLCHDVAEVRVLTEAAIKQGVVTQLGTQVASSEHQRTAVRWLQEGRIGKVTHAYLCSNRPGAVETYRLSGPRPSAGHTPPPGLNWDLWLGTAPVRPFAPDIYHPTKWRAWQDFGTGWSGDIGCHIFDPVWKGLGLSAPITVMAEVQASWAKSAERRADTWPQADHITWTFPGNDRIGGNELIVEWFDGQFYPPAHIRKLASPDLKEYPAESSILIGTEGSLLIPHGYPPQLLPEGHFKDVARPHLPPRNHYHHFVDACLGGEKTESHFAQTGPMTEAILLGTVAIRFPGEELSWDATGMRTKNHREANRRLSRVYRDGWHVGRF
jgi:predicted dehydrogenase